MSWGSSRRLVVTLDLPPRHLLCLLLRCAVVEPSTPAAPHALVALHAEVEKVLPDVC